MEGTFSGSPMRDPAAGDNTKVSYYRKDVMHMENITHVTMNSGKHTRYEDCTTSNDTTFQKMVDRALEGHDIEYGGIKLRCSIDPKEKTYTATIFIDKPSRLLLLETAGAADEQGAGKIWARQESLYERLFQEKAPAIRPKAPFVSTIACPDLGSGPSLAFAAMGSMLVKLFAIEVLNRMAQFGEDLPVREKETVMGNSEEELTDRTGTVSSWTVGKTYPHALMPPGEVMFDIDDCGVRLDIYFDKPTEHEVKQIESGTAFEMRLTQLRGVIFGLFKFGSLNWMDAPYSIHLSRNLTRLERPEDGCGYLMSVHLFDTATGKLCCNRLISLSTEMSRKLFDMATEQKKKPFSRIDHDMNISSIFAAYPTKQLAKMALCSYKANQ